MVNSKVFGGILLIGGSCIGAGLLGLPVVAGVAGFIPALWMLLLAWAFMTTTALLLVEQGSIASPKANLITLTKQHLGRTAQVICWASYLMLFYALLVGYCSASGNIVSNFLNGAIPEQGASTFFAVLFGYLIFKGTATVDRWNRFLMFAKIGLFVIIVLLASRFLVPANLAYTDYANAMGTLPILVLAFGFHNMIPTLMRYLDGNIQRLRQAILFGSSLVLVINLVWMAVLLGVLPLTGEFSLQEALKEGHETSQLLTEITHSPWVKVFAAGFGFVAVLTSFLAQGLSLTEFLEDAFENQRERLTSRMFFCVLAILPPLACSWIYPDIFFKALNFAGGICAVTLFGLLPAAMIWKKRYVAGDMRNALAGGKLALVCVAVFSITLMISELINLF